MAGTLDYVQKGEAITAEKWNALVERVNALEQRPSFGFGVSRRPKGGGTILTRLCQVVDGDWFQDSEGRFYFYADLLDQFGENTGDRVAVYAPYYATSHPGVYGGSRWYIVNLGDRWTLIPRAGNLKMSLSDNVLYIDIST